VAERVIQTSFSAGELSPKLYARVDLEKYGSGAALLRNMFVDYRGGASNRAGTKFIGRAKSNATGTPRLIPFIYSTDQAYILEFGNEYIRFIANQAYLLEAATTITGVTQANPAVVHDVAHGYSNGDEVVIESVGGMTELNGKNFLVVVVDTDHFSLQDLNGNAINSTAFTAYTSGGTAQRVYTLASPYAVADLPLLKYAQDANTLTLVHPSYPPYDLTRTGSTTFTLTTVTFGPSLAGSSPITVSTVNNPNDHSAYSYVVTGVNDKGEEGTVPFPAFIATSILNQNTDTFNTVKWATVAGAVSYRVYKAGPWAAITAGTGKATPPSITYGFIGTANGTSFIDVNIAPDYSQSPPTFQDPVSPGQIATFNVSSGGSGYATLDWLVTITATGGGGTGFVAYGLIDPNTGTIASVWLVNPGVGFTSTPTFSDDGANTATYVCTLGPDTGTYPAAVGYHQQRRFYGGTNNFPEAFFGSQTGFYNNFDTNTVLLDSDAVSASIAAVQVNAIKSFTSMPTGLVVLTTGGGFLVSGGGAQAAITPTNIVALRQPSSGCNDLPPLVINQDILYCQNRGFVVRDLAFNFYTQSYLGTDRSVLASHLFENFLPVDWTYAEQPYRQVLTVRNDGDMLAFTYVPEQEMFAWSHYDTQGAFLSVASIPEGETNAVYVLVKRHVMNPIGGVCWVNYVERMDPRLFDCLLEAWFLDCALEYPRGTVDSTIYLSGSTGTVNIFAYDPCTGQPEGPGPFSTGATTYIMEAKENYDSASAAVLFANTQGPLYALDQSNLGTSFDFANRNLMYLGFTSADITMSGSDPIYTNNTGHTLYNGATYIIAPSGTANLTTEQVFSPQVCTKNLDTGTVTFYPTYDATKTVPANVGCTYINLTGVGLGYTHAAITVSGGGGTGMVAVPILDAAGGGYLVNVAITDWGTGYTGTPTFTVTGDGTGATIGASSFQTPSDGTYRWIGSDYEAKVFGGPNGPNLVNPRNGDFWVGTISCDVFQFRAADNFAQTLAPAKMATSTNPFSNPEPVPMGIDATWCYCLTKPATGGILRSIDLVLIPAAIQTDETSAASKLTYVVWDSTPGTPFSVDQGARLTFDTDGNAYVFSLGKQFTRSFYWRLTKFTPPSLTAYGSNAPGTMTDLTPSLWDTGSINADAANYALFGSDFSASLLMTIVRLPATNQAAFLAKMPKEADDPSDWTTTQFGCVYVSFGITPTYDYHAGFVTGYMDSTWASVGSIPVTGYAVVDFRETNNYLEQSDHVYSGVDYTKRWFVFQCYPISGSAIDTSNGLMDVLVEYQFVYGSAPAVVSPPGVLTDGEWGTNYSAYRSAISQQNVVYNSMLLGTVPTEDPNFSSGIGMLYPDPGIYDPTTNAFWFSGVTQQFPPVSDISANAMFYLDSAFTYRAAYNGVGQPNTTGGPISPPFMRLTFSSSSGMNGDVLQIGCGKITITASPSTWELTGTVTSPLAISVPDDPSGLTFPVAPGDWTLTTPITDVSGLDHLEGKIVYALADGVTVGPLTVTDGSITLSTAATNIIVGLLYQSQLQTLELDVGTPTIQGKRKQIAVTTARLNLSCGLKAGRTFAGVATMKDCAPTTPPSLFSGDARTIINAAWDKPGQVCYQQDLPLPVTILGVIPEVVVGDTGK